MWIKVSKKHWIKIWKQKHWFQGVSYVQAQELAWYDWWTFQLAISLLLSRDGTKQYMASEFLVSLYLNDIHKTWTLGPPYIAQRHAYFSASCSLRINKVSDREEGGVLWTGFKPYPPHMYHWLKPCPPCTPPSSLCTPSLLSRPSLERLLGFRIQFSLVKPHERLKDSQLRRV